VMATGAADHPVSPHVPSTWQLEADGGQCGTSGNPTFHRGSEAAVLLLSGGPAVECLLAKQSAGQ
jgi:hypothetical protein